MTTFRGLLLTTLACSTLATVALGQGTDKRLAVVNGETITEKQVQTEASTDFIPSRRSAARDLAGGNQRFKGLWCCSVNSEI